MVNSRISDKASLTLYVPDKTVYVDHGKLIQTLLSIELIGAQTGEYQFLAGNNFFNHIGFLGCSPNIPLTLEQDEHPLQVRIPSLNTPALFCGSRAWAPLCPECKHALQTWKDSIENKIEAGIYCDRCHTLIPTENLNFRKRACYSRHVIHIEPVFESEAVPTPILLGVLADVFKTSFKYAYT